ncbi:MAG: DNA-3-methyladenine glycosylase I [Dehalococcoidia bacterium]
MQEVVEIPPKITPSSDRGYLEELTKAIFRSGFSWRVVREKWDSFRKSFDGFDLEKVSGYDIEDITRLFDDPGIIRNRRKILATIDNARTMLMLAAEHGSFHDYLRSLDTLDYYQRVKVLTKQFSGLGRTGAFVFLHCVNEETPSWDRR